MRTAAHYLAEAAHLVSTIAPGALEEVVDRIVLAHGRGATVFVFGNGGSAATASHLVCDLAKNASRGLSTRIRAMSLVDGVPHLTAWANDNGYESIFAQQLETYAQPGDVAIAISASGNSANVLEAIRFARSRGIETIALTGFDGGQLAALAERCIIIAASRIELVEDAHSVICHSLAVRARERLSRAPAGARGPALAVFCDRDGVINARRLDHVGQWAEFHFLPGVLEAISRLDAIEARFVIVTNQAAVGRGRLTRAALDEIHHRMTAEIVSWGGHEPALYVCAHAPEDSCDCRKPRPGLLLQAAKELGLDLSASVMIGDSLSDVAAAHAAGCASIMVAPATTRFGPLAPMATAADLRAAVELLLADPRFAGLRREVAHA